MLDSLLHMSTVNHQCVHAQQCMACLRTSVETCQNVSDITCRTPEITVISVRTAEGGNTRSIAIWFWRTDVSRAYLPDVPTLRRTLHFLRRNRPTTAAAGAQPRDAILLSTLQCFPTWRQIECIKGSWRSADNYWGPTGCPCFRGVGGETLKRGAGPLWTHSNQLELHSVRPSQGFEAFYSEKLHYYKCSCFCVQTCRTIGAKLPHIKNTFRKCDVNIS